MRDSSPDMSGCGWRSCGRTSDDTFRVRGGVLALSHWATPSDAASRSCEITDDSRVRLHVGAVEGFR